MSKDVMNPLKPRTASSESILGAFKGLRLPGMANQFQLQMDTLAANGDRPFNERLEELCSAELNNRSTHRINGLLQRAKLFNPAACPESIDMRKERSMNKDLILELVSCSFVRQKRFVSFEGAAGTGKTFLACALGNAACRNRYKVLCVNSEMFVQDLQLAEHAKTLSDKIEGFAKMDVLILDDWLKKPLKTEDAQNVSSFMNACYGKCSLIFCSQFPSTEWYGRIDCEHTASGGDSELADAIMDRIINNMHIVSLSSTVSMRKFYSPTGEEIAR